MGDARLHLTGCRDGGMIDITCRVNCKALRSAHSHSLAMPEFATPRLPREGETWRKRAASLKRRRKLPSPGRDFVLTRCSLSWRCCLRPKKESCKRCFGVWKFSCWCQVCPYKPANASEGLFVRRQLTEYNASSVQWYHNRPKQSK